MNIDILLAVREKIKADMEEIEPGTSAARKFHVSGIAEYTDLVANGISYDPANLEMQERVKETLDISDDIAKKLFNNYYWNDLLQERYCWSNDANVRLSAMIDHIDDFISRYKGLRKGLRKEELERRWRALPKEARVLQEDITKLEKILCEKFYNLTSSSIDLENFVRTKTDRVEWISTSLCRLYLPGLFMIGLICYLIGFSEETVIIIVVILFVLYVFSFALISVMMAVINVPLIRNQGFLNLRNLKNYKESCLPLVLEYDAKIKEFCKYYRNDFYPKFNQDLTLACINNEIRKLEKYLSVG